MHLKHAFISYLLFICDLYVHLHFFWIIVGCSLCHSKQLHWWSRGMILARNVRDQGSIPHWVIEVYCPLEPTVTFGAQHQDSLAIICLVRSIRIRFYLWERVECHSVELPWWSSGMIVIFPFEIVNKCEIWGNMSFKFNLLPNKVISNDIYVVQNLLGFIEKYVMQDNISIGPICHSKIWSYVPCLSP